MKNKLYIFGAGGFGREVLSFVNGLSTWDVMGFIDDQLRVGEKIKGYPVKGGIEFLNAITETVYVIIALGDAKLRQQVVRKITNKHVKFPVIIHPSVIVQETKTVTIGQGTIICAGVVLTNDISIGEHVLINLNTTIGHDVRVGDCSALMPGVNLAGNVRIGQAVLIGSGSNVRNNVNIADSATVGMGSVVLHDVGAGEVVAGVPAKKIR